MSGFAEFILSHRGEGRMLGQVLARGGGPDEDVPSPEEQDAEHAAQLLTVGYPPGAVSELAQRAMDVQAELEAERGKIEASARRSELLARQHAAGRISAWDIMAMPDTDDGDPEKVGRLERQLADLRAASAAAGNVLARAGALHTMNGSAASRAGQLRRAEAEAALLEGDGFEAAAARAHAAFAEATAARIREMDAGRR